jgi:hypothetical protein
MEDKYNIDRCVYCHDLAFHRHHFKESVANTGKKRKKPKKKDTVPTCVECNVLIGAANPEYQECCYILYDKVAARHKDILSMPNWDEDDMEELSGHLKRKIKASMTYKRMIGERLSNLLTNAQSNMTNDMLKLILGIE